MAGRKKQEVGCLKSANFGKTLNCVDLFAGAGGFSLAAKNVGFQIIAAIELNAKACETYRHNIVDGGAPKLYENDISKLSPRQFAETHFSDGRECDLLLGGPPCQGFSAHRIKGAGISDPRNQLLLRYFDFVKHLRPKAFLMENVPGLLWDRHKKHLDEFYKQGAKAGYNLSKPVVIDAQEFGVPQRRKRVFIFGTRDDVELDINWPPQPTHGCEKAITLNKTLKPVVTAASVFNKAISAGDENDLHMNHSQEILERFKATPKNGGSRRDTEHVLPCHKKHNGHSDVYGRIDPNKAGPTMTTACVNPSKGRFVHPTEDHGITLRHAARFQTFPDSFVFKGGLMAGGEQIGNAVPIKLGEALLSTIRDSLNSWSKQSG